MGVRSAVEPPRSGQSAIAQWRRRHFPQLLISPSLLIILGVLIIPIIYSLVVSFAWLNPADRSLDFVGLDNYQAMLTDQSYRKSMALTVLFTVITVILEMTLGIAIAMVLNRPFKGRGFLRGLMILPWALPGVVNAILWKWIFNANYGPLNAALFQLGVIDQYKVWLGEPVSAFGAIVIASLWKETPYVILLTIAALATIPKDLYESAEIDGAGPWKAFWRITLPMIRPVVLVLLITKTIWTVQTYDLIYIMTAGGPQNATQFITLLVQRTAFKYQNFGTAAAMSYSVSMLCFFLTYLYIKVFMRGDDWSGKVKQSKGLRPKPVRR
ncbi:MAG: sugar ABC transporter permease [Propionibacteriaceae bacterium]|jgi:multiple sugar transport system permease protein|nr:sugar ABC transporter permease [Propionibacteriaceae bacterium]